MIYFDLDNLIKKSLLSMSRLLFPPKCLFCREITVPTSVHENLCEDCEKTHILVGWINGETKLGPALIPVDGVFAGCEYDDSVKSAVVRLKFYETLSAANPLAYMMGRGLKYYLDLFDVIVPVPLSQKRLRDRGFNQSELISVELGLQLGIPVNSGALVRTRHTKKQSLTKGIERLQNIFSAFAIADDADLKGKRILLIDDVLTTGSTAAECARVLRLGGAEKIYVAVVALAV